MEGVTSPLYSNIIAVLQLAFNEFVVILKVELKNLICNFKIYTILYSLLHICKVFYCAIIYLFVYLL